MAGMMTYIIVLGFISAETLEIKEDFKQPPKIITNWQSKWDLKDGSIKTKQGQNTYSSFKIRNLNLQEANITFRVKQLQLNPEGSLFGIKILAEDRSILHLFHQNQLMRCIQTIQSQRGKTENFGRLPSKIAEGEDSPWTTVNFIVSEKDVKSEVDGKLIGTIPLKEGWINSLPITEIEFHAYQADISIADIELHSESGQFKITAQPDDKILSQLDVIEKMEVAKGPNDYRILYIGDSITRHGFTKNTIRTLGWGHIAGMAASTESNDYAHLFAAEVQKTMPKKKVHIYFHSKGGSGAARHRLSAIDEFEQVEPHVVVVQLGEHEKEAQGVDALKTNYRKLLEKIRNWSSKPLIICTGVWNPYKAGEKQAYTHWPRQVEDTMREICEELDIPFASVEKYALDPECSGYGSSAGVKWHPNDKGMQGYVEALFSQFIDHHAKGELITIKLDFEAPRHPIPRRILGHNLEAGDSFGIFRETHNYEPSQTGRGLYDPQTGEYEARAVELTKLIGASVLRYPGGCLAHNFDWKQTIGPAEQRTNYTFGINEYLGFCRKVGAEPLITVTTYAGTPQDAADLVEYLNAPAEPRFPWAMRRAEDGFADPYGVVLFEIGNESDHGNHMLKPFRRHKPEEYATFFNECAKAMKAIDSGVKVGAHMSTSKPAGSPWDLIVLESVGDTADFIAIHTYFVGVTWPDRQDGGRTADTPRIMQACMATAPQARERVFAYRDLINKITGRNIPIAVTEYNAGFINHRPIPYRFTFGAALLSVDFLRVLLDPHLNVFMANYWQYHEGFWGTLRRDGELNADGTQNYRKTPAFDMFRLFSRALGAERIPVSIDSPVREFPGYGRTRPLLADQQHDRPVELVDMLEHGKAEGLSWHWEQQNQSVKIMLQDCSKEQYPVIGYVETDESAIYRLQFEACFTAAPTTNAVLGIGLADARGWDKVRSACAAEGSDGVSEWTSFTTEMLPLHDCRRLALTLRVRNNGDEPLTGVFEARNIRVEKIAALPPYPVLTALASISENGDELYLIVFNKDHENNFVAGIDCSGGNFTHVRGSVVKTADLSFTNLQEHDAHEVDEGMPEILLEKDYIRWIFPARSMTTLRFK